jgi:uncharacterized GH25 family protein
MKLLVTSALITGLWASSACAHDVWLEKDGGGYRLVYGHPGALENYDPAKVKDIRALDASGRQVELPRQVREGQLVVQPRRDTALLAVSFDNGYWVETADGKFLNQSKRGIANYKSSSHSTKSNKLILSWSEAAGQPAGGDFEIIPLSNPLTLKPGDRLAVRVLYRSKPLAGADVEISGTKDVFVTDSDGKATLPIAAKGFQYIHASRQEKLSDDPDADVLSQSANLTFTL